MITIHRKPVFPAEWKPTDVDERLHAIVDIIINGAAALGTRATAPAESKCVWVPGPVIVGAGPSGLATAACLKQKGIPSLILERENCIASSWRLRTYDRLRLHLPKLYCELPFMEFPADFPTYPTRNQFISYLESYVRLFSITPMFGMEVKNAEYDPEIGFWRVHANGTVFITQWLVVATGENAEAVLPEIEGSSDFRGSVMHSCSYKNGYDLGGKKVLVVGCGNSGMEVCLDLCDNGAHPSMVVRDKLHILPREILGCSTFGLSMSLLKWLPVKWVDSFLLLCSRAILGDTRRLGLERPKMGPLALKNTAGKTPVLDVGAVSKIKSGHIKIVPAIRRFMPDGAEFVDGRKEMFDSVIFATGYRSNVPSWLKDDDDSFSKQDGFPKKQFPHSWMGKNGLYAPGFTRRGLMGASMDAHRISDHIASQWNARVARHFSLDQWIHARMHVHPTFGSHAGVHRREPSPLQRPS